MQSVRYLKASLLFETGQQR